MKRLFSFIVLAFIMLAFAGCQSITRSTKNKQVNITTGLYGLKVTAFDPTSASFAPTGWVGFGSVQYHSVPMNAGQPFFVIHEVRSIWNSDNPATRTTIWIGRAATKSNLSFEVVPNTMIKVSADSIKTGTATVKVIPDKNQAPIKKE